MTPALRKRHRFMWWFLTPCLLIFFMVSLYTAENKALTNLSTPNQNALQKTLSIQQINGNGASQKHIEIQVKQPLTQPQTLIYLAPNSTASINASKLLGRIEGVGTYVFQLDSISAGKASKIIKGYDAIHQKELFTSVINN